MYRILYLKTISVHNTEIRFSKVKSKIHILRTLYLIIIIMGYMNLIMRKKFQNNQIFKGDIYMSNILKKSHLIILSF